jgi:hypothetical protein
MVLPKRLRRVLSCGEVAALLDQSPMNGDFMQLSTRVAAELLFATAHCCGHGVITAVGNQPKPRSFLPGLRA